MKSVPVVRRLDEKGSGVLIEHLEKLDITPDFIVELMEPHKHDYYTLMLVDDGSIDMLVDFQHTASTRNKLFISRPGQVHQFVSLTPLTAWYLSVERFLINDHVRNILEQSLTEVILIDLSNEAADWFRALSALMVQSQDTISTQALHALASSFIIEASVIFQQSEQRSASNFSFNQINIAKKFRQLVRQQYKELKRPNEYADLMNLSVSYLNDTVRTVTGFSLSHFIQREIIVEAQRLLYYTELSVKEIGIGLGFEDYKYFNRLFSKVTGIPPGEFRKNPRFVQSFP